MKILSFGYPKADTCGTCDIRLRVQLESAQKVSLQKQKEDHLRSAEGFYGSLRTNTTLTTENHHIRVVTFDFQQNLPLPHIPVGEVFYMRQLWLYVWFSRLWLQSSGLELLARIYFWQGQ